MVAAGATGSKSSAMIAAVSRIWRASRLGAFAFAAAAALIAGCLEPPPSFRVVALGEARELLRGEITLVDARSSAEPPRSPLPGSRIWQLDESEPPIAPELAPGPVLVVAEERGVGLRAAAALARDGNRSVYLVIPQSAEQRDGLYARGSQQEEIPRDRDS